MNNLKHKLAYASSIISLSRPGTPERSLEVLANSVWSTMMVTGLFFVGILFVFLSVRVGKSITMESSSLSEPVKLTFLLSFAGLKYIHNHVRHHLFQTPLLPRRRFSSLSRSNSWIGRLRTGSLTPESVAKEYPSVEHFDGRRHSVASTSISSGNTKRRPSIKQRRSSVAKSTSTINTIPVLKEEESEETVEVVERVQKQIPVESRPRTRSQTRRNTMPHIEVKPEPLATSIEKMEKVTERVSHEKPVVSKTLVEKPVLEKPIFEKPIEIVVPSPSISTTTTIHNVYSIAEEEDSTEEHSDQLEMALADLAEEEETIVEEIKVESIPKVPEIPVKEKPSEPVPITSNASFKSTYFNYLPESIFGYSTTSIFSKSPITSSTTSTITSSSTAMLSKSPDEPPGFTKRHSLGSAVTEHQPLYARRPTATTFESRLTSLLFSSNGSNTSISSTASKPRSNSTVSTLNASAPQFIPSGELIERSGTASPHLEDLQNTRDLFAPINWNFDRSASDVASEDSVRQVWSSSNASDESLLPTGRKRTMSAYASSIFN